MNIGHLKNLVTALRECKEPDKFTMERIMYACGTPGCALGQYAFREDLQDEFKLMQTLRTDFYGLGVLHEGQQISWGDDSVLAHFDLSFRDIALLFDADGCDEAKTPNEAADFVESFIQERALEELASTAQGFYEDTYNPLKND